MKFLNEIDGADKLVQDTSHRLVSDEEKNKLAGIENGATADMTASEILTAIKTVDGSDSGLDADLLDGKHASDFAISGHTHDYAPTSHAHGNIKSNGTITATVVTPASTDYLLISDTSNSGKIERGIIIGTDTSTYLRNNGTWGTPTNTTYSAISTSEIDTGTSTTSRTITAQRLKYATDKVRITLGATQPTSGWWFKEKV